MQNPEWSSLGDRNYTVKSGEWISRGWQIFQQDVGAFIGFVVVVLVINIGLSFVPGIGQFGSSVLSPVLNAGFFIYGFKILREQPREFSDFFQGFSQFLDLFLFSLVSGIFAFLPMLPGTIVTAMGAVASQEAETPSSLLWVGVALILVGLIPSLYLGISYSLGIPLIIDRRAKFWPAMELSRKVVGKHWWGIFGFSLLIALLNFAGALLCGLGLLATIPISTSAIAYAYSDILGLAPKLGTGE